MDEDTEDEAEDEVQGPQDSLRDSPQDRTLDRMHKVKAKDKAKPKDSQDRGIISPMHVISAEELATGHTSAPVEELAEVEEDAVVIAEDVLEAEARDVRPATRVWLAPAILRGLEPSQDPPSRRETSEAPEWPVQWTDGACTPEPSKPIWRGSTDEKDLNDADAEEKIAQTEASDAFVCDRCGERCNTSS